MYTQHQSELATERAERARVEVEKAKVEAEKNKAEAEYKVAMANIQKEMNDRLRNAKSDEERSRIREEAARAALAARGHHGGGGASKADKEADAPKSKIKAPGKHDISDNPLDGLTGL
jgi:hypothetical protein